ncbi:MAG: FAD-binding oxidoreductase [Spirochaetia bacterium]|nr:FAD-binding oxidoreductase [Spirochaetia bacterium]
MIYHELDPHISYDRANLRWNGWGAYDRGFHYAQYIEQVTHLLAPQMQMTTIPRTPSVELEDIRLTKSRLTKSQEQSLLKIMGRGHVKTDRLERVYHAVGRSYYDVVRLWFNKLSTFPDVVVYPTSEAAIQQLFQWCRKNKAAVIPFGGGSSVVGGVESLKAAGQKLIVSADMTKMERLVDFDPANRLATFEAGIYGPRLEAMLNGRGYTLGHFPQSFEYSTLGGWLAARSAGQQSNRYGKIEELVNSVRLVTPQGTIATARVPASSTGPDMDQIAAGSEGLLGIITQGTVKVHPLPEERRYLTALCPDFASGVGFVQAAAQAEIHLSMARLSDVNETAQLQAFAGLSSHGVLGKIKGTVQALFLRAMGIGKSPCILMVGLDGTRSEVRDSIFHVRKIMRDHNLVYVGEGPGRRWLKGRFNMPFLRNHVMEHGIGVDTMETATTYDKLLSLHDGVLAAASDAMPHAIGMCHISHSYLEGACLYFTFMFPMDLKEPVRQWTRLKNVVSQAITKHGGTISHHHGVGADHAEWYLKEAGPVAVRALRSLKAELDPDGILNPGKLFAAGRK